MIYSIEQVTDSMIYLLQKNVGARTVLASDVSAGGSILQVDNTLHFEDSESVMLMDTDPAHPDQYNTILQKIDTNTIQLVNPVQTNFTTASSAVLQKAIGNVPLAENRVLFGDREVIPGDGVTITVDPQVLNDVQWMWLQGGLSVTYNLVITVYMKMDINDNAIRTTTKYGDFIFKLLVHNIHTDILNQEWYVTQDMFFGDNVVYLNNTDGVDVGGDVARYELQDNNHAEIDFKVTEVLSGPPRAVLNRQIAETFRVSDKLLFRKRIRYMWNTLPPEVEYGYIQKGADLFKAAKITWWGRETDDVHFPQVTMGDKTFQ